MFATNSVAKRPRFLQSVKYPKRKRIKLRARNLIHCLRRIHPKPYFTRINSHLIRIFVLIQNLHTSHLGAPTLLGPERPRTGSGLR